MPAGLVRGKEGEKAWERAKQIVRKNYPDLANVDKTTKDRKLKDRFYALVVTLYKSVCKSPKYQCEMVGGQMYQLLTRLEAQADAPNYRKGSGSKICSKCRFAKNGRCTLYNFKFRSGYTCDSWQPKKRVYLSPHQIGVLRQGSGSSKLPPPNGGNGSGNGNGSNGGSMNGGGMMGGGD